MPNWTTCKLEVPVIMPNWTTCKLEAPAEVISKYLSKDEEGHTNFDFNLVIPRPKIYDDPEMIEGGDTGWCIYWYLSERGTIDISKLKALYPGLISPWTINYGEKMIGSTDPDKAYERGKKYVDAYKKYGYTTWYSWSNANWGTKWNACDTYYDENSGTLVEFDTAWCPPMPVIEKIFKDNPGKAITFTSYDEDYSGHYELFHDENNEVHEDTYWIEECANDYDEEEK